ncbi:hypothetical protein IQ07DRAFT_571532 [Pyrenochaeta sp. DS3sAY3a]|nr:hypothetical protein IQ07DRAFT_571532 [Pyrenochaeta sp. DS3sAY3a]
MHSMQNFVKGRDQTGSAPEDHHAQSSANGNRRRLGANAKVSIRRDLPNQQGSLPSGLPARGAGHTQNTSALVQQHAAPRQTRRELGHTRDQYDTDAGSLDTTSFPSTVKGESEDNQTHRQRDQDVLQGEDSDTEEEDEEDQYDEQDVNMEKYEFTHEDTQYLREEGAQNLPRHEQVRMALRARGAEFLTIDGDSYPTTTNGDPSEWLEENPRSQHHESFGNSPASNQMATVVDQSLHPVTPASLPRGRTAKVEHALPQRTNMFHQSAAIRDQERSVTRLPRENQQPRNGKAIPATSQPPTYSQVHKDAVTAPQFGRAKTHKEVHKPLRIPRFHTHHELKSEEPRSNVIAESTRQHQYSDQRSDEETESTHDLDYDTGELFAMSYDKLKDEDFDTNPRAGPQVLTDDVLQKPLTERLEFVQKNLDAGRQGEFFRLLPASEWEEAGDWFLDQFSSIIQRSKEARQKKRKIERDLENEVEERFRHVSKKQEQIKGAMSEMKTQGEGIVSKSPRASKSPMPKRR